MEKSAPEGTPDGRKPGRRGAPKFQPSEEDHRTVEVMTAFDVPVSEIITCVIGRTGRPIPTSTFYKYFKADLDHGRARQKANLTRILIRRAETDTSPAVATLLAHHWLGMRNETHLRHGGERPGEPIRFENMTDKELAAFIARTESALREPGES